MPILPLVIESYHLAPDTPASKYSIAFRFSNWMAAVPTIRSGLQRRIIEELFKDAGAPLRNSFLIVVVKGMSFGPSQDECVGLK